MLAANLMWIKYTVLMISLSQLHTEAKEDKKVLDHAYACLATDKKVDINCQSNEVIHIDSVVYGGNPDGCGDWVEKNSCIQHSKTVTENALKLCEDKVSCTIEVTSLSKLGDELIPELNACTVGKKYLERVRVNFMLVKYKCIDFVFCESFNKQLEKIHVTTKHHPLQSVTNPTCPCTFRSEKDLIYIRAYAFCNGSVTFVTEEDMMTNGKQETQTRRYFCNDHQYPDVLMVGSDSTKQMRLTVDADNSSEFSSYSLFFINQVPSVDGKFKRYDGKVIVACEAAGFFIRKTVRIVLYTTIPVVVLVIVALIVLYCICKRRRRKYKTSIKGKTTVDMEEREDFIQNATTAPEDISLTPSDNCTPLSTRKKPEGAKDSASDEDDDIGAYAAKLHHENLHRRLVELKKREAYNSGSLNGSTSFIPRTYSPPQAMNYLAVGRPLPFSQRRIHSTENVNLEVKSEPRRKHLQGSKSVSNSRTSLKSVKRRAPQPPPGSVPFKSYDQDDNSLKPSKNQYPLQKTVPDLDYDDPRRRGSRDVTPTRTPYRSRSNTLTQLQNDVSMVDNLLYESPNKEVQTYPSSDTYAEPQRKASHLNKPKNSSVNNPDTNRSDVDPGDEGFGHEESNRKVNKAKYTKNPNVTGYHS